MLNKRDLYTMVDQVATKLVSGNREPLRYQPTGHEQVCASIVAMEPIPAGANPFIHDDFSMGTDLPRGWVIMHPGFDSKDNPLAMEWIYLVNTRTGQRIQIELAHNPSEEQLAAWKAKTADPSNEE